MNYFIPKNLNHSNLISFKGIYLGLLFTTLIIFFSGCKTDDKVDTKARTVQLEGKKNKKQVRFIGQWLNEGKREKLLRDFVREYEFEHQDVDIVFDFPENIYLNGNNSLTNEQFVAQIITKENPEWDIIRLNNQYNEVTAIVGDSLWAAKYLVDFSEYPEFRNNTMPELVSDEMKGFWKGIIPGPFIEGQYYALWSNSDVAKKIGITVKQKGMTFDDFKIYIKAVYDYNKAHPNDYIKPFNDGSDWLTLLPMAFQMYASELNDNKKLYTVEISEQKLMAWYRVLLYFEELSSYNFGEYFGKLGWIDCGKDILHGKALFYINGSWMYNIWEKDDPELVKRCYPNEFPLKNPLKIFPGNYLVMWGVLKNSPNKEEAIKFLLSINKPEIGDKWVNYTKSPTGIKTTLSEGALNSDQFDLFTHHVQVYYGKDLYQVGDYLKKYIVGPNVNQSIYHYEVIKGELTAKQAYEKLRAVLLRK